MQPIIDNIQVAVKNFENTESFYEALMQAHEGLDESQSQLLNARLILVLANHIGDLTVLKQAIETARLPED
jgi:phage tail protein X